MPLRATTLEGFAAYLGRPSTNGAFDDDFATGQLEAAEEYVETRIPYELAAVTEERELFTGGESVLRLPGGLRTVTTVAVDGYELAEHDYRLIGRRGYPFHLMLGIPWDARTMVIDGAWGFEPCPASLLNGIYALAARDHFQKLNKQADVSQSADGAGSSYYDRIPTVTRLAISNLQIPSL